MTEKEVLELINDAAINKSRKLYLAGCRLRSLPREIERLTSLEVLILGKWDKDDGKPVGNRNLKELPPEIGNLKKLRILNLSYTSISQLPPEISYLSNLQELNIHFAQLSSLPIEISKLSRLRHLDCRFNRITRILPQIDKLTRLKLLNIRGNCLVELPPTIGQLKNLDFLDIRDNQLPRLPSGLFDLSLVSCQMEGNQLPEIPPEVEKRGYKAVFSFLKQLEKEKDRVYEAKLIIIGEAGAGKTSLAKKIQDESYALSTNEDSTEGVDVFQWKFSLKDGKYFSVNIWDFGGQEIYHATHQFFLTKRSVYALVADSRKEDTDFYYWLRVAELFGENSPLLIIKNEKQDRQREINERQLRGEFEHLKDILATNLYNNRGLAAVSDSVQHYLCQLPHIGTELPASWVKVREILEDDPRNYIALDEYLRICQANGFTALEDKLYLSEYFHDLGIFLHFQEDDLLKKTIILKPNWGTNAVYSVLDNPNVVKNFGKFDRTSLEAIWNEPQYAHMHAELLRLMMNFKLCYEIPSSPGTYIAPQLLNPNQREYLWDEKDNLFLHYEYEFMPKGILSRLIVELNHWIEQHNTVWKSGVVLVRDGARAEVIEYYRYHKGEIRIRVSGNRKQNFLAIIKHEFEKIHISYQRLRYKTLVPCNCSKCKESRTPHFYPLNVLHKFLDDRQESIQCAVGYEMVNVNNLIRDFNPDELMSKTALSQRNRDSIEKNASLDSIAMTTDSSKYSIRADVVQIVESNPGEVIAKKYASDPAFIDALTEISQILETLQRNHPKATESEAQEIIEVEFQEIRVSQPKKWNMLRQQLLHRERWLNGGKAALSETAKHYVNNSVFYKAGLAFLDGFSQE